MTVMKRPFSAMLSSTPEAVPEFNSQKGTPCCAKFGDDARAGGSRATSQVVCGLDDPQALACDQSTRLVMVGQWTGAGTRTQDRVGVLLMFNFRTAADPLMTRAGR